MTRNHTKNHRNDLRIPLLLFPFLFLAGSIFAQDTLPEKIYLPKNVSHDLSLLQFELYDGYLSPLYYNGYGLQYRQDVRRVWSEKRPNLSMQNCYTLNVAVTLNPARTAAMTYLSFEYKWGMYYHFRRDKKFSILLGGTVTPEIGGRMLPGNTNNVGNLDLGASVNLAAQGRWKIPTKKRVLQFNFSIAAPIMGLVFAPEMGASYYEIFYLEGKQNVSHFTSFHNKYAFYRYYSLDIPFKNSIFRIGVQRNLLKYYVGENFYKRKYGGIMLGWQKNIVTFAGRKSNPPKNTVIY
ncbi:DUF3316 domain-containing protein [Bacteroidales bacterium OttesenSCG-928-B11]|nr:DUF3316 domain-containing protein [Bacteroidales bacterium OttesenSCG-928-E04]MDL2313159.1 DUF3316 domain-containing protein [Bacteroidales bacterium OttesenSCG-928-B11]MDL2326898.1 DUF3316 domain-containing protein [Bacteroidales bacterium OttesenSCG-928-A14]